MSTPSSLLLRGIGLLLLYGCVAPADRNPAPPADSLAVALPAITAMNAECTASLPESPPATTSENLPPAPHLTTYTVGEGETLWLIAARTDVYADALLWPLLYKANRDQIKDPAQIFPGQQLSVPRHSDESEREAARDFARKSGIFSGAPAPTLPLVPAH